jgi:hypothetical protein
MGPVELARLLPAPVRGPTELVIDHLQHGTFQRSMALLVTGTSVVTGMEVAYEHYKGSYSNVYAGHPLWHARCCRFERVF